MSIASPSWPAEWATYENNYFVVHSYASEKRTNRLLAELDDFRRATMTIANVTIPKEADKPRVFITKSRIQLRRYASNRNVLGFASQIDGKLYIFVTASGRAPISDMAIRHEYAHILLRYSGVEYPAWFEEGFAEFLSATEVSEDGETFSIGSPPLRTNYKHNLGFTWEELISKDLRFHEIRHPAQASGAYFQAWLLTHFAILGDERQNSQKLSVYFDELSDGAASSSAFEKAFETPIASIWETHLESYSDKLPLFQRAFSEDVDESPFRPVASVDNDYQEILEYFSLVSEPGFRNGPPIPRLSLLAGKWDVVEIGGICDSLINVSVSENEEEVIFDPYPASEDAAIPRAFSTTIDDNELLRLVAPKSEADQEWEAPEHDMIAIYKNNLFCIGKWAEDRFSCHRLLTKCGK